MASETSLSAMQKSDLKGVLPLIASGKVRDLYKIDDATLLFVATDRISAYDVIMKNGVPEKGKILTLLTQYWFGVISNVLPDLKTHYISLDLPSTIPASIRPQLQDRSMQVRRLKIFPIEAIVRGFITGSAWAEYQRSGTVNGKELQKGMQESEAFREPLYTPSTKAEQGEHDVNITVEQAAEIVGEKYAERIEMLALMIYSAAAAYAWERGVIIADTKFEFGLDEETGEVVLVDEILTPDSSRFWRRKTYEVGRGQESFDKQYLRDWLVKEGLKGKDGVEMPDAVVEKTAEKYRDVYQLLTGRKWSSGVTT